MILIVEDDALERLDAVAVIEEAGFGALEAATADEAIAFLEARQDIAVVFTDVEMPGSMDGVKLAHAVAGRWPPVRIIATSGHFTLDDRLLPDGGRFISKPYAPGHIKVALSEVMASGG